MVYHTHTCEVPCNSIFLASRIKCPLVECFSRLMMLLGRVMTYGEHYVFGVTHPDEGKEEEEETEVEGWDADMENAEVGKLLPVESALIRRLRVTKFKLVVSLCHQFVSV